MSNFELIKGSCADQVVDAVVNAANDGLWEGGGICGVIFSKAGSRELAQECAKHKTPLIWWLLEKIELFQNNGIKIIPII